MSETKERGKPVDAQHSCRGFDRVRWSLDEEPAVCENCAYEENGYCKIRLVSKQEN